MVLTVKVTCKSRDSFVLHVAYNGTSWDVDRKFEELFVFHEKLGLKSEGVSVPTDQDDSQLTEYFNRVLSFYRDQVWSMDEVMEFLDNEPSKSFLTHARMCFLTNQIHSLRDRTSELECSHKDLKAQVVEMRDLLKLLGGAVRRNSKVVITDSVDEYFPTEHAPDYSPGEILYGRPSPRLSLISEASSLPPAESLDESQDFISTSVRPSEDEAFKSLNADVVSPESPVSTLVYPVPSNAFLAKEAFPSPEVSAQYADGIEFVLKTVGPYERQLAQRQSALAWLKRQVRIALGTAGFEGGLHATHCLMPEDSFRLNLAISKGLLPNWHILLCERLHSQIDKASAYGGTLFIPPDDEDSNLDPFFQEANVPTANHSLGPVYHNKNNMSHTVYLTIDNMPVEIVANSRTDFCWQALVEEVDELVGQQHVFKKTFLLVRAWWAYETPSYVGTSIRHYLTDHQLLIMLLSVFNRYWEHITSPLQALLLFFSEFTAYDGSHQVITLQGIVPFQTRASSQPNSIEVKSFHFLNTAFVEKYWQVFNVNVTVEMDAGTNQKRPSSSSEEPVGEAQGSIMESKSSPTHGPPPSPQHHRHSDPALTKATLAHLSINNLHHFDRSAFNILHPFTHTNMITERLSARRVNRIVKAFQTGVSNLLFYMKRVTDSGLNPLEAVGSFFPGVFQAYKGRLPSYEGASMQELITYKGGSASLLNNLAYIDLITEAIVTEHALETLAMEILATKGPLPVGEIGKVLADITSIPNLSQKLKEKFGGLKKFIEQFPSSFVISNDHPFNPNVLLRASLAPDQLEMIDNGMFPPQLLAKAKKAAIASKKKKSHSIPSGSFLQPEGGNYRQDYSPPQTMPPASNNRPSMASAQGIAQLQQGGLPMSPAMAPYRPSTSANTATKSVLLNNHNQSTISPLSALKNNNVPASRSKSIPQNPNGGPFPPHAPYYNPGTPQAAEPYGFGGSPAGGNYRGAGVSAYPGYNAYPMQYNEGEQSMRRPSASNLSQYSSGAVDNMSGGGYSGYTSHATSATLEPSLAQYGSSMSYHTDTSSNSNSYSGNNNSNPYVMNSLLQAMAPPSSEPSVGYSNSLLSQLRADSVEVSNLNNGGAAGGGNMMFGGGQNSAGGGLYPDYKSTLFSNDDEGLKKDPLGHGKNGNGGSNGSYVSRLFLS